jgi:hypothetical protein
MLHDNDEILNVISYLKLPARRGYCILHSECCEINCPFVAKGILIVYRAITAYKVRSERYLHFVDHP